MCRMQTIGRPGRLLAALVAVMAVLHAQHPAGQNGTAPGDATPSAQSATELPAGDGRDVVVAACSGCHGLSTVTEARRTRTSWEDVVDEMTGLGAKFEGDETKEEAIAYLRRWFGRVNVNIAPAKDLQDIGGFTPLEAAAVVRYRT